MKIIKFRAWDKDDKVMRSWEEIDFTKDIGDDYYLVGYKASAVSIKYDHEQIIMQYTGLKDKNGVDIYEGDILKDEQTERLWKINFRNHAHGLYFVSYYPNFDNAFMRDFNSNKWAGDYWEVVGNIYENPELLEEI